MKEFITCSLALSLAFLSTLSAKAVDGKNPAERLFQQWDKNNDGVLEKQEVPPGPRRMFDKKDANNDGIITLAEHIGKNMRPPRQSNAKATFTIHQTWNQQPDGYDRPVYVAEPAAKTEKAPVIIYFHGAGGDSGGQIKKWAQTFSKCLVIAPQGYLKGWNIQGESTNAPDIEFFQKVIVETGSRYPYADMNNVSLIGSSNGAAYIYRIMTEVEEDLFQNAVPMVSSLLEAQYHSDSFWKPSGETDSYDTRADPVGGKRILYIHGTEDKVVPFGGGLRSGRFLHLSAYETACIWAKEQGYKGDKPVSGGGKDIGDGLVLHEFEESNVTFIEVTGGSHGLAPHREAAIAYIREFLGK